MQCCSCARAVECVRRTTRLSSSVVAVSRVLLLMWHPHSHVPKGRIGESAAGVVVHALVAVEDDSAAACWLARLPGLFRPAVVCRGRLSCTVARAAALAGFARAGTGWPARVKGADDGAPGSFGFVCDRRALCPQSHHAKGSWQVKPVRRS